MAYVLYAKHSKHSNYSNYLKIVTGKFRHFFHGQLFFRLELDVTVLARSHSPQSTIPKNGAKLHKIAGCFCSDPIPGSFTLMLFI